MTRSRTSCAVVSDRRKSPTVTNILSRKRGQMFGPELRTRMSQRLQLPHEELAVAPPE